MDDGSLTESVQAKTDTVDQKYRSNFWETTTGEGGRLDIIDYICPHCHKNIFYQVHSSNTCIHCGTPIFSAPRRKLDAKQHRNWRYDSFLAGIQYTGPNTKNRVQKAGKRLK